MPGVVPTGVGEVADAPDPGVAALERKLSEMEAKMESIVRERAGTMEDALRSEFDREVARLERELQFARAAAEAARAPEVLAPDEAAPQDEATTTSLDEEVATPTLDEIALPPEIETPNEVEAPDQIADAGPPSPAAPAIAPPVVVRPELTFRPRARYPATARRMGREARVAVSVLVGVDGRPASVELVDPPVGLGFDEAALAAARATRWQPGTSDGVPAPMHTTIRFAFQR